MDDTVIFEKSTIHGIVWDQGPDASSVHHTCFFKLNDKCFFVSDTYIQEILYSFSDMSAYNNSYILVYK